MSTLVIVLAVVAVGVVAQRRASRSFDSLRETDPRTANRMEATRAEHDLRRQGNSMGGGGAF